MEYRGFCIREFYGDYSIYGIDKNTIKYGHIRTVATIQEAIKTIDKILDEIKLSVIDR